jgi:hypothetical protein
MPLAQVSVDPHDYRVVVVALWATGSAPYDDDIHFQRTNRPQFRKPIGSSRPIELNSVFCPQHGHPRRPCQPRAGLVALAGQKLTVELSPPAAPAATIR